MPLCDNLIAYCKKILDYPYACQKHKWACQRFLDDLKQENTDDFPYVFNEERAQDFLNWMGLFRHRKGILKGEQIKPHEIQVFVFANIYGWYHRKTGYRRFNKFYWQVARKNGKSQSLACVGTYELIPFNKKETNEVYVAATKREQARIVYDEAVAMLLQIKELKGKYRVAYGRITYDKNQSIMRALSEDDKKTGDGLNVQCGIVDEYHAHETSEIYDIIDSGMGARAQPLLGIITTAGFDLNCPCYQIEYQLVSKILDPNSPVKMENYFVMINELDRGDDGKLIDDIKDEKAWEKANPIVCSYPEGRDYLRKKLKEAQEAPEKMRNFLTKHMNIWVQQRNFGYMNAEKWAACAATKENPFPDIIGKKVFCGLDLSATTDLTSVGFEIPLENDFYTVLHHSFVPEEKLNERRNKDNVPYDLWIQQGYMTATPGATIDHHFVLDYILQEYEENKWPKEIVCFDAALATWLTSELMERGFAAVEIRQNFSDLSLPTKDFRAKVYDKKIIHNGDPVLSWAIYNAVTRAGPSENLMLDKGRSKERIDPIACLINAHARAMLPGKVSVYSERGLRSLS